MKQATDERTTLAEDVINERFGAARNVMRVNFRLKSNGCWKHEHHTFTRGTERMKELARDPKVDRLSSETVPNPISEIPESLGGGTVDLSKPSGCPECGAIADECESWCELARHGR